MGAPKNVWMIKGSQFPGVAFGPAVPCRNGKYRAAKLADGGYVLLWKANRRDVARIISPRNQDVCLALIHSTRLPKVSVDEEGACLALEGADNAGKFRAIIYVGRQKKEEDSFRRKGGS